MSTESGDSPLCGLLDDDLRHESFVPRPAIGFMYDRTNSETLAVKLNEPAFEKEILES